MKRKDKYYFLAVVSALFVVSCGLFDAVIGDEEFVDEAPVLAEDDLSPDPVSGDGIPTVVEVEQDCAGNFDVSETDDFVTFDVRGDIAVMRGEIDLAIVDEVEYLLAEYPQVETIVLAYVPGGDADAALEAALMVHEAGLATCVPRGGEIDSSGVDFYLAGAIRRLADDAFVGVHSWADDFGVEGGVLPADHPDHQTFVDYFETIGVDSDFYWYTLEAANSEDIHNMTPQEREEFEMEIP